MIILFLLAIKLTSPRFHLINYSLYLPPLVLGLQVIYYAFEVTNFRGATVYFSWVATKLEPKTLKKTNQIKKVSSRKHVFLNYLKEEQIPFYGNDE